MKEKLLEEWTRYWVSGIGIGYVSKTRHTNYTRPILHSEEHKRWRLTEQETSSESEEGFSLHKHCMKQVSRDSIRFQHREQMHMKQVYVGGRIQYLIPKEFQCLIAIPNSNTWYLLVIPHAGRLCRIVALRARTRPPNGAQADQSCTRTT